MLLSAGSAYCFQPVTPVSKPPFVLSGTPNCVTVSVCPAIVTVPWRELYPVLADAVMVRLPLPVPSVRFRPSHAASLAAVQGASV